MTFKETLFFVGRCLTINHVPLNKLYVSEKISNNSVDWDKIVQVSTAHYVFPTLYINLKKADLLGFLPKELVNYMHHITSLNRDRNFLIIKQAKEIYSLLKKNGITPVFIKGTAFLLQDFYADLAERMVGDIDFLVSEHEFEKTIKLLTEFGYENVSKLDYHFPAMTKHYPRIKSKNRIAAVEIHYDMTVKPYRNAFNYKSVIGNCITVDGFKVLGFSDQVVLTLVAKQINDKGFSMNTMSLRNAYDAFLLSQITDTLDSISKYPLLFTPLNNFLALCNKTFQNKSFSFKKDDESQESIALYNKILEDTRYGKKYIKKNKTKIFLKSRLRFILKSFTRKDYAYWIVRRITDKTWYKEKMIQLGLKSKL